MTEEHHDKEDSFRRYETRPPWASGWRDGVGCQSDTLERDGDERHAEGQEKVKNGRQ
jgi:hypothetical protein